LKDCLFCVETLANLISQRATRQAVIKMAVAASREVGVTLDLQGSLKTVWPGENLTTIALFGAACFAQPFWFAILPQAQSGLFQRNVF
jgi:hypothetical protein